MTSANTNRSQDKKTSIGFKKGEYMEAWKDIRGYEGLYQVSSFGRIRSLGMNGKRARIMTQEISVHGYCRIGLWSRDHVQKHYSVHRLVANAFIGDCEGYQINHLDEIKTNNRVENLQIVTSKENCNYGTRNEKISKINKTNSYIWDKPVVQYSIDGEYIAEYASRLEAERQTGVNGVNIGRVCMGKRKTAGGYIWKEKV